MKSTLFKPLLQIFKNYYYNTKTFLLFHYLINPLFTLGLLILYFIIIKLPIVYAEEGFIQKVCGKLLSQGISEQLSQKEDKDVTIVKYIPTFITDITETLLTQKAQTNDIYTQTTSNTSDMSTQTEISSNNVFTQTEISSNNVFIQTEISSNNVSTQTGTSEKEAQVNIVSKSTVEKEVQTKVSLTNKDKAWNEIYGESFIESIKKLPMKDKAEAINNRFLMHIVDLVELTKQKNISEHTSTKELVKHAIFDYEQHAFMYYPNKNKALLLEILTQNSAKINNGDCLPDEKIILSHLNSQLEILSVTPEGSHPLSNINKSDLYELFFKKHHDNIPIKKK